MQSDVEVFEAERGRLRAIAYRILGSLTEADDALQETWLRVARSDLATVDNVPAWLTTVTARICLNLLRDRHTDRVESFGRLPDPIVGPATGHGPEQQALLADSVGLAMLVVLDSLSPAERVAFVLHDMFAVPFEEIAPLVGRSAPATRQLASRARRRVQDSPMPDHDLARQRIVVDAFFAAARTGDLDALLAVLDPQVVLRADGGRQARRTVTLSSPAEVAAQAVVGGRLARFLRPALINGTPGAVTVIDGRPYSLMAFTVVGGRITAIDILLDPDRLAALDLVSLDAGQPDRPEAAPGGK